MAPAVSPNDSAYHSIETVLKGPEIDLDGYWYEDEDGHTRTKGRVEWWNPGATTLREVVRIAPSWSLYNHRDEHADELPSTPLADLSGSVPAYPADAVPVLFGHYWFKNDIRPSSPTTACVDFSAVKGGRLVAYRWDGEPTLISNNFVAA
jgi:hypothetical protein